MRTVEIRPGRITMGHPRFRVRATHRPVLQCLHYHRMIMILLLSSLSVAQAVAADPKVRDISFDNIKFEMKKGDPFERKMLTPDIEKLVGSTVKIRGYILPSFQQQGIKQFVLVRDNMECCFGPGAALYDCILVEMEAGKSTSFTVRPVAVQGIFQVSEFKGPDGKHLAIYRMVGHEVK